MLPPVQASKSLFGVQEVDQFHTRVWRLDDYRNAYQLPLPDLIKLDVQGFEVEVLQGAGECLRSAKGVLSEVSFIEYYEGQCLFHDVVGQLAEFGLFVRAFGFNTVLGSAVGQTDVLFLRTSCL